MVQLLYEPPEWVPAPVVCPKCKGQCYVRVTPLTQTPQQIECSKCAWGLAVSLERNLKRIFSAECQRFALDLNAHRPNFHQPIDPRVHS